MSRYFPFDASVTRAQTIPARLYTDPVFLELERERVFGRTWQLVGRTGQVEAHGQFFTAEVAGEPIVVLRDRGTLRGFHNVCLHRAGPVASGCGRRDTLQCRYHGWTYRLDGSLYRAPGMDGAEAFSPDAMHLVPVQVQAWGPLVFANLDLKAPPLFHFLEGIPERVKFDPAQPWRYAARREYPVESNWKVYVDNYLEGYHIPLVHPSLHKELDDERYRVEPRRYYSIQHAPLRAARAGQPDRLYVPAGADDSVQYYWIFPNLMLNLYFGQLQTNVVLPDGPDRTLVVFEWFSMTAGLDPDGDEFRRRMAFSDRVQEEDAAICGIVQKNLRSRVYDRGRFSPRHEVGVHHFHGLLHEFMS